ncbi:MAG: ATP-binding cassette domain-containing protein [Armatimonadetes bacterium]|nr:ATP-binding cassette domain-containing protein [Armatimonadota bacterium]
MSERVFLIGRHPDCDLVLDSPLVSRQHAEIRAGDQGRILRDLGSSNGTFVHGKPVQELVLRTGQLIYIGPCRLVFDGERLEEVGNRGEVEVEARDVSWSPAGDSVRILNQIGFTIRPGEFVALVGASGAGKSTLMKCLSGQRPPTEGQVLYNGLEAPPNMDLFRPLIGFVPQDDIVHRELPVEAALRYSARLRLPQDTSPSEIQRRIDFVLASMHLSHRRSNRISTLSGGERKRVSIAAELLTEPSLFFLDEPTSGLDPGLEKRSMQLLARLARQGRTVILVTHATQNIVLCDRVAFLAPGGRLVYYGPPREALDFFEVEDFADIYLKTGDRDSGLEWEERYRNSTLPDRYARAPRAEIDPGLAEVKPGGPGLGAMFWAACRQFAVLLQRYAHLVWADRANLALMLLQAPVIGLVLANLFEPDLFALDQELGRNGKFPIHEGPTLLFMMLVTCIFFGAINSCREVVKELSIFRRERLVNLMLLPYMGSKVVVLGAVGAVQSLILLLVIAYWIDLHLTPGQYVEFYGFLAGAYLGGVGLGLLLSCFSSSGEQATTLVSVVLILQLVFSGAFVKPEAMGPVIGPLSVLAVSRWGFAGLGEIANLNSRFEELGMGWITADFYMTTPEVWSMLGPLVLLQLAAASAALRWRESRE